MRAAHTALPDRMRTDGPARRRLPGLYLTESLPPPMAPPGPLAAVLFECLPASPRANYIEEKRDILKEINCNPMPRLTAFISGMVQKTGYRARVVILAKCLRAAGIRADLPSGMVKVVAEGEQTDLGRFLNSLTSKML